MGDQDADYTLTELQAARAEVDRLRRLIRNQTGVMVQGQTFWPDWVAQELGPDQTIQTRQLAEQPAATPIIKNLTPHAITLYQHGPARWGYQTVIQPSGAVADVETVPGRLLDTTLPVEEVWSPIAFGEVVGLPPPEKGVVLLVSHKVASAAKRADVYSPPLAFASHRYNDGTVRNKKGEIVGVTRLVRSL